MIHFRPEEPIQANTEVKKEDYVRLLAWEWPIMKKIILKQSLVECFIYFIPFIICFSGLRYNRYRLFPAYVLLSGIYSSIVTILYMISKQCIFLRCDYIRCIILVMIIAKGLAFLMHFINSIFAYSMSVEAFEDRIFEEKFEDLSKIAFLKMFSKSLFWFSQLFTFTYFVRSVRQGHSMMSHLKFFSATYKSQL